MIQLGVEKSEIKKKIRRIIGKAHIGMSQSQLVGQLLAKLDFVVSFARLSQAKNVQAYFNLIYTF